MSSFDINRLPPGTQIRSPFANILGSLKPGISTYSPYDPLPIPTISMARALAASQGNGIGTISPLDQQSQQLQASQEPDIGLAPMSTPQLTPSQLMDFRQLYQPDYEKRIGGAISGFENASNAYQQKSGELASKDEKLLDEAARVKSAKDFELADLAGQRQGVATEASRALASKTALEQGVQQSASKEIGDLYAELKKNSDVDPDRYMKNMSTGSAVATAISLVLGGIGSGLAGGPNYAAGILENRINSDIRAQIEKKNGLKDLIAEKRAQIGDSRADLLGTANLLQLDSAQKLMGLAAHAEQVELKSAGTLEGNAAGLLKNEWLRKAQDKFIGIQESMANLKVKGYAQQADIAASQQSAAAKRGANEQILPSQLVATAPVRPEMAKAVTEKMGDYNEVMGHLSTLEKLREKAGKSGVWTGQDKYEALQTSKALFNAKRKMTGSGAALSPVEEELIKMKDPNKVTIGFFDDVLGEIRAEKGVIKRSFRDQLRANNVALREDAQKQQFTQGWQPQ